MRAVERKGIRESWWRQENEQAMWSFDLFVWQSQVKRSSDETSVETHPLNLASKHRTHFEEWVESTKARNNAGIHLKQPTLQEAITASRSSHPRQLELTEMVFQNFIVELGSPNVHRNVLAEGAWYINQEAEEHLLVDVVSLIKPRRVDWSSCESVLRRNDTFH